MSADRGSLHATAISKPRAQRAVREPDPSSLFVPSVVGWSPLLCQAKATYIQYSTVSLRDPNAVVNASGDRPSVRTSSIPSGKYSPCTRDRRLDGAHRTGGRPARRDRPVHSRGLVSSEERQALSSDSDDGSDTAIRRGASALQPLCVCLLDTLSTRCELRHTVLESEVRRLTARTHRQELGWRPSPSGQRKQKRV